MKKDRDYYIILVAYVTLFGNAAMAVLKLATGFVTNSFAVVGDGIDSSTDVIISIIALFSTYVSRKPPDKIHTFGHKRAETIGTKLLSFIILFAGIQLFSSSIGKIISGGEQSVPNIVTVLIVIMSIIGKLLLSAINFKIGKKIGSDLVIANAKNMRNDIFTSTGVLLGLIFTIFLKLPILDPIIAMLVALWILKTGVEIFLETSSELMDGIKDKTIYNKIFDIIKLFDKVQNPHRVRVRKLGNYHIIDMDIEVSPEITVKEAHDIATAIEVEFKDKIENIYDIMIHTEPYGYLHRNETFGLNERNINE